MYKICNGDDEFEPRAIPKPTTKLDCLTTPAVPEVSLIFDKPFKENTQTKHVPTSILRSAQYQTRRENIGNAAHPNTDETYAAWRKQNQFRKSTTANPDRSTSSKVQSSPVRTTHVLSGHNESQYVSKEFDNDATRHKSEERYIQISNSRYNVAHSRQQNDKTRVQENKKVNSQVDSVVSGQDNTLNGKILRMPIEVSSNQPNTIHNNEYPPTSHMAYHYPYFDTHGYPFPPFYGPPMNTHNTDSQETVKNLLQLVNNQSEQIKSLQLQVDRLLKMQEECFKERQRCSCQGLQQNDQVFNEAYDTIGSNATSYNRQAIIKSPNQHVPPKDHSKNMPYDNVKAKQSDSTTTEFQSKNAFMEQKVSIGVMTSFEFTVQNNPFTLESENYERNEIHKGNDGMQRCNAMNLCDKNETLRKYKNAFSRVPPGQLENIVEDSESYLSSSQQHTSNINSSASTRDIEKPVYMDGQKGAQYSALDFPRSSDPGLKATNNGIRTQNNFETNYDAKTNTPSVRNPMIQKAIPVSTVEQNFVSKRNTPNVKNKPMELSRQEYDHSKGVKDTPIAHRKEQQRKEFASTTNNPVEDSLILSSCDLKVTDRPPSPEPSIHVEMNEYSSDDESEKVKRTSKVGWTFYNNVLGQVNQILQNNSGLDEKDHNRVNGDCNNGQGGSENLVARDTVKVATLEQLRKLGISLSENIELGETNSSRMIYDSSFYPRLDHQANVTNTTSAVNETNTSLHMKALAMKYLSDDQLAELAIQRQGSTSLKQLMLSNMQGTNMSFATMRYLERYQLLPGKTSDTYEGNAKPSTDTSAKAELKFVNQKQNPALRFPFNQTPRTTCPSKILDISTLKQQPKLL